MIISGYQLLVPGLSTSSISSKLADKQGPHTQRREEEGSSLEEGEGQDRVRQFQEQPLPVSKHMGLEVVGSHFHKWWWEGNDRERLRVGTDHGKET